MTGLINAIAEIIRKHVKASARSLQGATAELRSVFRGPPLEFLRPVFEELARDQGIEVELPGGHMVRIPVVLQVDFLPDGACNPVIGACGMCDGTHGMSLRNSPECPRFVALIPPGRHTNLSFASASDEFGLAATSNAGNSTIDDWWRDVFVQQLVDLGLSSMGGLTDGMRDEGRQLIERAIRAADRVDRHDVARPDAWRVLSRLFSRPAQEANSAALLALVCGFPPKADSTISADEQDAILGKLAEILENDGFRAGIDSIKAGADPDDARHLEAFLRHLEATCDMPTMFSRATPFHYGPLRGDRLESPPDWWRHLTVERWIDLLEEEHRPTGVLQIECTNSIIPAARGLPPVTLDRVALQISRTETPSENVQVTVVREIGAVSNRRRWSLGAETVIAIDDDEPPSHRSPIRYVAEAPNLKKASAKVVSLRNWEPGFVLFCRTAAKTALPKRARSNRDGIAFECAMTLNGLGRHYVDVYTQPTVSVHDRVTAYDAAGGTAEDANMARVSDGVFGFEIEATGDCSFDMRIQRPNSDWETVRLQIACEDIVPEGCRSEFERLIRLNRQPDHARGSVDVQVDRRLRCTVLEAWILDKQRVERSFYPVVLSSDYGSAWRPPEWRNPQDTIISLGRFLHDPRPRMDEMRPPDGFIQARAAIAERLRGADDGGLTEAAKLGEWLDGDPSFAELLESYVQAYLTWLRDSPDCAAWCDVIAVCNLEPDGSTLIQDPDALLVSPMHPVRLAWHAVAQRTLYLAYKRHCACPAASILDPDSVPDALVLPIQTATGAVQRQAYFSVECSSDYWSIVWNASRLDRVSELAERSPFDEEFGVRIGGVSSGFSVSQVQRSLDDVEEMLGAKPILSVMVTSASGQTNACNEGIMTWCRDRLAIADDGASSPLGGKILQVLDHRKSSGRPEDAEISNLAEDTGNAVRWFSEDDQSIDPDLGIIAQLETSNARQTPMESGSPVGVGALLRHRIRRQLQAGSGAFLTESRMGEVRPPSGDGLADKLMSAIILLENLGETRVGYTFAPSVHAIQAVLKRADYAAVSSSVVDPACFLGGWLPESYLWDYDLPSYSHRAGDTNGYYLISRVKELDRETLRGVLRGVPRCDDLTDDAVQQIILEVARRGIPTVRGLSGGDSGASGDLGLFIASRLIQDEFRSNDGEGSLVRVAWEEAGTRCIALVMPVDPFKGYLEDLRRSLRLPQALRPDLLVAGIRISESSIACRLTPVEVKYRGSALMSVDGAKDALEQARALAELLIALRTKSREPDLLIWRLAYQHLLLSMIGFGFRVYSQQRTAAQQSRDWTAAHARLAHGILSDEIDFDIDTRGRLILIDGSTASTPRDIDGDRFAETIALCPQDASSIVRDSQPAIYSLIRDRVKQWDFMPREQVGTVSPGDATPPAPEGPTSVAPSIPSVGQPTLEPHEQVHPPPEPASKSTSAPASTDVRPEQATSVAPKEPAPEKTTGIELLVGHTVGAFRSETRQLNLSDTNLNQLNIGVVGDLGTGKTQLLKALVYQMANSAANNRGVRPRVLIFDYKKDYSASDFVQAVGARVVRPQHLPFNLFDVSGAGDSLAPWLDRFKFFSDVLDKIYSNIGPVQRQQLKQAVRGAYEDCQCAGKQPTLYDVHAQYRSILGTKTDSPLSIIDDLVDMEMFAPDPGPAASFERFLDGVVVIALDALGQDDRTKNMLVAIMLNLFYEHMLRIPKRPYLGTQPQLRVVDSFLLVDEADNIMRYEFDVLRKVLLQGREFGVGVILASQYLRHFKAGSTDYREPLLTWFIHKVPNVTPQELAALGLTADVGELVDRIKTLSKHQCLFKTPGVPEDIVKAVPFFELNSRAGATQ